MDKNKLKDLMLDANLSAKKNIKIDKYDSNDLDNTLRQAAIDIFGTEKVTYRDFRKPNAYEFFEVMEEVIMAETSAVLQEELEFAEYVDLNYGESREWIVENPELFNVAIVAKGNGNVRRQRLDNGKLSIETEAMVIRIFEQFRRFMSGAIDWSRLTQKVIDSYVMKIKELVWTALFETAAYNNDATYNQGTASFDQPTVDELIDHVQAANNQSNVAIVGTKQMLRNFVGTDLSDAMINDLYERGYYRMYNGTLLMAVGQLHKAGTDTFLLPNNKALILPMDNEKIVKIVEEGEPIIDDAPPKTYGDMSKDFFYYREVGVGVITAKKYGVYTITG